MRAMSNEAQIEQWNGPSGETWVAMQDRLDRQLEPLGRAAIAALAPGAGEQVADIGCGSGDTTRQLAERVGPTGRVVGVDVSAVLLAHARSRTTAANVTFVEADAQVHALPAIDAVFSRFGVMFFDDPVAAFANLHRALRPGGRLAFVCWRTHADNPILTLPLAAAVAAGIPQPPAGDPLAPGPFAFADAARVTDILGRAGFADIVLAPHDEAVGGNDLDGAVELAMQVGPLGRLLREHPDHAAAALAAVRAAIAPYATPAGVLMPSATWIVTASRRA